MNHSILQRRYNLILLGFVLILSFCVSGLNEAFAQPMYPHLPVLSLTGGTPNSYNKDWYPDGRIRIPVSNGSQLREILVPVFVNNRWAKYNTEKGKKYIPDPITSFQFTIQYDSASFKALGYQLQHPDLDENTSDNRFKNPMTGDYYKPLAHTFNISWYDEPDTSYKLLTEPSAPLIPTRVRGRAITIVGSSETPLQHTDLNDGGYSDWRVLCYIRFQVLPRNDVAINDGINQPLMIANDTIRFNDYNVIKDAPFKEMRYYDSKVQDDYPDPVITDFPGVVGMDNRNTPYNTHEPTRPGVIYCNMSKSLPEFSFDIKRKVLSLIPQMQELEPGLWQITDPLTCDSSWSDFTPNDALVGTRIMQVWNSIASTRLNDIKVETDQPWLLVRCVKLGAGDKVPMSLRSFTRQGSINWMDNGLLGDVQDPMNEDTEKDGDIQMQIQCNENLLNPESQTDPERTGVYVGYITFSSPSTGINPVRVRVTFIRFRNPEDDIKSGRFHEIPGIEIIVTSKGPESASTNLIFGTNYRATDVVDTLFGEHPYITPMEEFDARWFPVGKDGKVIDEVKDPITNATLYSLIYGLGDWAPYDETATSGVQLQRSNSRDIRSNTDTSHSIQYLCIFNADPQKHYPVVLEWDTKDFPDDAFLFLKDTINGNRYPMVDMRNATIKTGTKRVFYISDPNIKSFMIEYTLPRIVKYVDTEGNPIIKTGWNLLSMPVRPVDANWKSFYKNAMNKPYFFSQNQWQEETTLRPGVGYFVKYSDTVDKSFAGAYISNISNDASDDGFEDIIRVYRDGTAIDGGSWSLIGGCTKAVNVEDIEFSRYGLEIPNLDFVLAKGIWGYRTNQGYYETAELVPGFGYWMKTNFAGYLKLSAPWSAKSSMPTESPRLKKADYLANQTRLTIRDNAQHEKDLYLSNDKNIDINNFELPPLPMAELFDARYITNTYLNNSEISIATIQGVEYPLSLFIDNADAKYTFVNAETNQLIGTIEKGKTGNVEVAGTNGKSTTIKILKSEVDETNDLYIAVNPNPVSSVSTVKYNAPSNERIIIKLYDAIGNEVLSILDEVSKSGEVTLNSANLVSGRYICKITCGNQSSICPVTIVK